MYKYEVDYECGLATFYTEEKDHRKVINEFISCAGCCFGIRKSLGEVKIIISYENVELPIPYRDKGATQFLSHHGDQILFDDKYKTHDGDLWKLLDESGDWCSCKVKGEAELSCGVHHFWVKDHDKCCKCSTKQIGIS